MALIALYKWLRPFSYLKKRNKKKHFEADPIEKEDIKKGLFASPF